MVCGMQPAAFNLRWVESVIFYSEQDKREGHFSSPFIYVEIKAKITFWNWDSLLYAPAAER